MFTTLLSWGYLCLNFQNTTIYEEIEEQEDEDSAGEYENDSDATIVDGDDDETNPCIDQENVNVEGKVHKTYWYNCDWN